MFQGCGRASVGFTGGPETVTVPGSGCEFATVCKRRPQWTRVEVLCLGPAGLHLVDGVSLLRPEDQVFSAMLAGFANQQLARNLARSTVEGRENTVRAFANYVRKRRRPQDRPTSAVVGFCLCYRKSRSARAARCHRTPR